MEDINNTLADAWGSGYVNDFVDRGRVKRVFIQGDESSRMLPQDFNKWYVRNTLGQMVPFSAFATGEWAYGSPKLERYNGVPSMEILGMPAPGQSTGDAMAAMENLAAKLPAGHLPTIGPAFPTRSSGPARRPVPSTPSPSPLSSSAWPRSTKAGRFRSPSCWWCRSASLARSWPPCCRGLNNDVFFQVGLLTTIGLSAKNAILIVEFAKANFDSGMDLVEATVRAAHQRLRPILMTSLAFVFGVLPLAMANGAGSGGQNAIGTGVIGGMFAATVLAIFFVPLFFVMMLPPVPGKA